LGGEGFAHAPKVNSSDGTRRARSVPPPAANASRRCTPGRA
jgi:hypothetical protein